MPPRLINLIKLSFLFLLLISIPIGCSAENVNNSPNSSASTVLNTYTKLKHETITFCFPGNEPKDAKKVLTEIEKRVTNSLNVSLDFQWLGDDWAHNINKKINSDESFEAYYMPAEKSRSTFFPMTGMLNNKDFSDLFKKYAPDYYNQFTKNDLAQFYQTDEQSKNLRSILSAIPVNYPETTRRYAIVREDLMKKYNIPEIKTFDDYEYYLKTIKRNEPDILPSLLTTEPINIFAEPLGYEMISAYDYVCKWNDTEMKVYPWEQTPEYKVASDYLKRWLKQKYMIPFLSDYGYLIKESKLASIIDTYDKLNYLNILSPPNCRFEAYPLYPDRIAGKTSLNKGCMVLNPKSTKIDRALMFVNWVESSQVNYDLLMYGIKGVDYELEGEKWKLPNNSSVFENPYLSTDNNNSQLYSFGWPGRDAFINIRYERDSIAESEDSKQTYLDEVNRNTRDLRHTGFVFREKSGTQATARVTQLYTFNNMIFDSVNDFLSLTPEYIIATLKNNYADELANECQQQLDNWRKSSGQ